MSNSINLDYCPKTYFRPEKLEKYLLSKVKGAVLRKELKALFGAGRHDEAQELLRDATRSLAGQKALESVHPMFMGGNYLPDADDNEVEIARISIQSTTFDVTSVYAKPVGGTIHYRVVDEYGGDTLQGPSETITSEPMTLREFADFFLTAWPLIDVLEMNYEEDLEGALEFFSADSDFYPEFDRLCRQRVRKHFPKPDFGDECPFCDHFNSPPAGDVCEHAVGWVWDGLFEALAEGREFEQVLREMTELIDSEEGEPPIQAMLRIQAHRYPVRQDLIEAAVLHTDQALIKLANARVGQGWSTEGWSGGYGYTIYLSNSADLIPMMAECRAILDACRFNIKIATRAEVRLQRLWPSASIEWRFACSGSGFGGRSHSYNIGYFIANPASGCWVMETRERNAMLDDLSAADITKAQREDGHGQGTWLQTLDHTQDSGYEHMVAWIEGADSKMTEFEMGELLFSVLVEYAD